MSRRQTNGAGWLDAAAAPPTPSEPRVRISMPASLWRQIAAALLSAALGGGGTALALWKGAPSPMETQSKIEIEEATRVRLLVEQHEEAIRTMKGDLGVIRTAITTIQTNVEHIKEGLPSRRHR